MKAFFLIFFLIPTITKACSPPLDGSSFTCPPYNGSIDKIIINSRKKSVTEPIYNNKNNWQLESLMKKVNYHKLQEKKQTIQKMINKAIIEYKN